MSIWNLNFDEQVNNFKKLINESYHKVELLLKNEKTYTNFVKPYMDLFYDVSFSFTPISHLNSVCNSAETQSAYEECLNKYTEFTTDISQNVDIYEMFKEVYEKGIDIISNEQKRVLLISIREFELEGVNLSSDLKSRLKEINMRLSVLSNNFFQNVLDDTAKYKIELNDDLFFDSMPENDIAAAKYGDKYVFTLKTPSYTSFMTYCKNRGLREDMYKAYFQRGISNSDIIEEILALRYEKSKIVGYNNYAEYSIVSKDAKSPDDVLSFLYSIVDYIHKPLNADIKELKNYAATYGLNDLKSYDILFLTEKIRKERFGITEEAYRPYFEKNNVLNGLLDFLFKLLELKFIKTADDIWDSSVSVYDVFRNDSYIGKVYFDLESRSSKRDGAWMNEWGSRTIDSNGDIHNPSVFVVCNFPVSSYANPSLLRHDDVVTLFHEMGHTIHHLCSKCNEYFVSGINGVEWDVVEFPSQWLENFAYEPEILKTFGRHYKTGEIIPDDMCIKLKETKNFQAALFTAKQSEYALFDMLIHLEKYSYDEVQKIISDIRVKVGGILPPEYIRFQNQFSHIFSGGYAAGYYSYKWAERLSAELFYLFIDNGIFNKDISSVFYENILSKGGSINITEEFENTFKMDVNVSSLMRLYGLDNGELK